MKIVQTQEGFKPVSIVLESQDEVNWAYELFGSVCGQGKIRDFTDGVYCGLLTIADENVKAFKGCVEIN